MNTNVIDWVIPISGLTISYFNPGAFSFENDNLLKAKCNNQGGIICNGSRIAQLKFAGF